MLFILWALVPAAPAQDAAPAPAQEEPRIPAVLDFDRDRGRILARVDGRPVRLGELAKHLERYDPHAISRWRVPEGSRDLNSPRLPRLVYQYADVLCLRAEAKERGLKLAALDTRIEQKLAEAFAQYIETLRKARRTDMSKAMIDIQRRRHRREQGLMAEVQALLDLLLPPRYTQSELRVWHTEHGDVFGGQVKLAHILLELRDPRTGRLKPIAERRRLRALAHDIYQRAAADPSLFAELARKYSDDSVTRPRGGELRAWSKRINPRLPAVLVKTAWELNDGAISPPVESYYGIHIVRRFKQVIHRYLLLYGKTIDRITKMKSKLDQEQLLLDVRRRHSVQLHL